MVVMWVAWMVASSVVASVALKDESTAVVQDVLLAVSTVA